MVTLTIQNIYQPYITRPSFDDLNPNKNNQGLCIYPLMVTLDRCNGSCNTLHELSGKIYFLNKAEDVNSIFFNMTTKITETKILAKDISCVCEHKFDARKYNLNQEWNKECVNMSAKIQ